jgi:hypothetical protein
MMAEDRFWDLIDSSRQQAAGMKRRRGQDFVDVHEHTLAESLRQLSPDEIIEFDDRFHYYVRLAYRWDIWGAAYWLHGGCGDDGFLDFRSCLVSLGKKRFFQVLKAPDVLADIVGRPDVPYMQAEGFQYVAMEVYKEKTGEDIPLQALPAGEATRSVDPAGDKFDFEDEDEMRQRFPKIVSKYPEMGD